MEGERQKCEDNKWDEEEKKHTPDAAIGNANNGTLVVHHHQLVVYRN